MVPKAERANDRCDVAAVVIRCRQERHRSNDGHLAEQPRLEAPRPNTSAEVARSTLDAKARPSGRGLNGQKPHPTANLVPNRLGEQHPTPLQGSRQTPLALSTSTRIGATCTGRHSCRRRVRESADKARPRPTAQPPPAQPQARQRQPWTASHMEVFPRGPSRLRRTMARPTEQNLQDDMHMRVRAGREMATSSRTPTIAAAIATAMVPQFHPT